MTSTEVSSRGGTCWNSPCAGVQRIHHGFRHAVVQQRQQCRQRLCRQRGALRITQAIGHAALDAAQLG